MLDGEIEIDETHLFFLIFFLRRGFPLLRSLRGGWHTAIYNIYSIAYITYIQLQKI